MMAAGLHSRVMLLLCFASTAACNTFAFTEEPPERAGKADGYCSRILRAQSNRKEGNNEFRLRVEGDPDSYQPGSTYRGWCLPVRFTRSTLVDTKYALSNNHTSTVSRLYKLKISFYRVFFLCVGILNCIKPMPRK